MSFFGCLATGVVMVEYITPPDLPLMDSQLGSSWAHIGWGEQAAWSGPTGVRVQIFLVLLQPGLLLTIIQMTKPMTVIIGSCDRDLALKNELRWDQINAGAAVFSWLIALILETNQ